MCSHDICAYIKRQRRRDKRRGHGGVGMIILNNYYNRGRYCVLLGEEKCGSYSGKFNLCAGKLDLSDDGCYIKAAKRELMEEFKLTDFNKIFKMDNGRFKVVWYNGTPVFVGIVKGLSRDPLNRKILRDNFNPHLSFCHKEIHSVDWFWLDNKKQIENKNKKNVSKFADRVMDIVYKGINEKRIKL